MTEPKKEHIRWRDVYRLDDETILNNDLPYDKWPQRVRDFFDDVMDTFEGTQAGQDYLHQMREKHGHINVVGTMTYMVGDRKLPHTPLGVPRSGKDMVVVMQNFQKLFVLGNYENFVDSYIGVPLEQLRSREMRVKTAAGMVGHEVGHHLNLPDDLARKMGKGTKFMEGVVCGEKIAVDKYEERIRAELGLPPRKVYVDTNQAFSNIINSFERYAEFDLEKEDLVYLKRRLEGKPVDRNYVGGYVRPDSVGTYNERMKELVDRLESRAGEFTKQNVFACTHVSPAEMGRASNNLLTSFVNEQIAKADKAPKDNGAERQ